MLNNRELAGVILLGLAFIGVVTIKRFRKSLWPMVKSAFAPKLAMLWIGYVAVTTGTVTGLHQLGLGYLDSTKDAVVWAIVAGLPILFSFADIGAKPDALRRKLVGATQFTAFVEFYVNLYVFPLWLELIVQATIVLIGLMIVVSELDEATLVLKRVLERLLTVLGVGMLVVVTVHLVRHRVEIDGHTAALSFGQPLVLTVGVVCLTYVVGLISAYELAFMRVGLKQKSRSHRLRAKAALLLGLHVRMLRVHRFTGSLPWRLAEASSWRDARRFVADYKAGRERAVPFDHHDLEVDR